MLKGFSAIPVTCFIILIINVVCYALIGEIQTKMATAPIIAAICAVAYHNKLSQKD